MNPQTFEFRKVTPFCGVEVLGIDLSQPLDDRSVETLKTALAEHCVLFFRDQKMTPKEHKAWGRHFGQLHIHPAWPRVVEGHPEVMEIYSDENTKRIAGEDWHSDVSCDPEPSLGTILHMIEVAPVGGDTLFANGEWSKLLFVNRIFTTRIVQLSQRESDAVLQMLFEQTEQPEFQCRFQWQPGSVAFWENRCAQHHAVWDYHPHRRRGLRVTIQGDAPFYRHESGNND